MDTAHTPFVSPDTRQLWAVALSEYAIVCGVERPCCCLCLCVCKAGRGWVCAVAEAGKRQCAKMDAPVCCGVAC